MRQNEDYVIDCSRAINKGVNIYIILEEAEKFFGRPYFQKYDFWDYKRCFILIVYHQHISGSSGTVESFKLNYPDKKVIDWYSLKYLEMKSVEDRLNVDLKEFNEELL